MGVMQDFYHQLLGSVGLMCVLCAAFLPPLESLHLTPALPSRYSFLTHKFLAGATHNSWPRFWSQLKWNLQRNRITMGPAYKDLTALKGQSQQDSPSGLPSTTKATMFVDSPRFQCLGTLAGSISKPLPSQAARIT